MPRSVSLTLAAALCLALATSAQAQIPNPLRRAKEKAAQALSGQPASQPLKFDNVMLELNPQVVERVIAGLQARAKYRSPDGRTSAEMRRRAQELTDEAAKLNQDRGDERSEFVNKVGAAENCRSEVLSGIRQKQNDDLQRRFMGMTGANLQGDQSANAKFMQEYQRIAMEVGAAAAAQDTARARKAQAEYNKLMGIDSKADTAKANVQCNVPVPPAWMARADAADAESSRLYNEARELERVSSDTAVRVSGLGAEQFAMAVERVTAYVTVAAGARGIWKFSAIEEGALSARLAVLRPLVG